MQIQFETLQQSRNLLVKVINKLTLEQLNTVPKGFHNSIAWNLAHLTVTQQLLCYKLSGLDGYISDKMIQHFQKGTAPEYYVSQQEFDNCKELFLSLPETLKLDYNKGIFKKYKSYTTSVNVTLNCIEDAIAFNNYHEGIHLGVILQLKKLV